MTEKNEGRAMASQNDTHVNSRTYTLDLADGVLIVTVTETPDRVCFAYSGAGGTVPDDGPKFLQFDEAIWMRYERDPRPIYTSGRDSTAKLFLPSGYLLRYGHAGRT